MVSTKDHFLYIIHCDYAGEEVWSSSYGKSLGFLINGSYSAFTGTEGSWSKHSTVVAPAVRTRHTEATNEIPMGWVAINDNTLNITVVPKENSTSGAWANLTPLLANADELSVITENGNTAFVINEQCFATSYRDLDTFNVTSANTHIPDSEVTIV